MKAPRKVGFLGGTFDPVHRGHLAMARAAEHACGLQRIYFVPAAQPWHRGAAPEAGYADRYAMLALALQGQPRWLPLAVPDAVGQPTYTIDQTRWIREHGWGGRISIIIGADAFATLPTWHRWRELLSGCDWVVLARAVSGAKPSWEEMLELLPRDQMKSADSHHAVLAGGHTIHWLPRFAHSASATGTRSWLARSRPAATASSPVPAAVVRYARRAGLYQPHG